MKRFLTVQGDKPETGRAVSLVWKGLKCKELGPLNSFRPCFLLGVALGYDGRTQSGAEIFGQFVELGIAINFDGLFGGIANHVAVVAPGQMIFQFGLGSIINQAVKIIG